MLRDSKKIILILIVLGFYASAFAQEMAFTVISMKGYVSVGSTKLKIGSKISNAQTIKVDADSYICLATKDNRVLEITKSGTYDTKNLASKVPQSGTNEAYVKFVVDELTKVEEDGISAKNRFQHMNKTGAVKRGTGMLPKENEAEAYSINFFIENIETDDYHNLYGNDLTLAWQVKQPTQGDTLANYEVELLELDETSIFSQQVSATEVTIDLSLIDLEKYGDIICQIIPLDSEGKHWKGESVFYELPIKLMNKAQKEEISKGLKGGTTAIECLMNAKFFEDKKLFFDAAHAYKEAIRLSGNNPTYTELYYRFWVRNSGKK